MRNWKQLRLLKTKKLATPRKSPKRVVEWSKRKHKKRERKKFIWDWIHHNQGRWDINLVVQSLHQVKILQSQILWKKPLHSASSVLQFLNELRTSSVRVKYKMSFIKMVKLVILRSNRHRLKLSQKRKLRLNRLSHHRIKPNRISSFSTSLKEIWKKYISSLKSKIRLK